jgi:hypothetical protein
LKNLDFRGLRRGELNWDGVWPSAARYTADQALRRHGQNLAVFAARADPGVAVTVWIAACFKPKTADLA